MSTESERIAAALEVAANYGATDGAHHKMWVIDQMVRNLTGCPTVELQSPRPRRPRQRLHLSGAGRVGRVPGVRRRRRVGRGDCAVTIPAQVCAWCEEAHPEHISIEWFPGRLYFCSDGCYGEWGESA